MLVIIQKNFFFMYLHPGTMSTIESFRNLNYDVNTCHLPCYYRCREVPPTPIPTCGIRLTDVREESGIDFEHYGERHRWCEIGPQVQGIATNEEIPAGLFEDPFEFANRHLVSV